jgi:AraC-like DNA-binding protein
MSNYTEREAHQGLRRYIAGYWLFSKEAEESGLSLDYAWPEVNGSLLFVLGDPIQAAGHEGLGSVATGGIRRPIALRLEGRTRLVGLRFRPGGMRFLLDLSPAELGGLETLDGAWFRGLAARLEARAEDDADGIATCLDDALGERLAASSPRSRDAVERSCPRCPFRACLSDLARANCRSARSLQREWPSMSGYCPSEDLSIARCEMARAALFKGAEYDLSTLALDLGFCDLPHFCKSFKRWTGFTPRGYARFVDPYKSAFDGWYSRIRPFEEKEGSRACDTKDYRASAQACIRTSPTADPAGAAAFSTSSRP